MVSSICLRLPDATPTEGETFKAVLNRAEPVLVLKTEAADDLRFHNKRSVMRLYRRDEHTPVPTHLVTLRCQVYLRDVAIMSRFRDALPLAIRRLFDYVNSAAQGFVKLHLKPAIPT